MAKTILSDAGYEVTVVSNGAAAYKKIQESPPDVLILDIFMPGYSGLEICEKIRAERATASIPVLLTVGKMEPYRPEDGARVEADGVIVKPFEASDLLAVMQQFEAKITAARARSAPKTAAAAAPPDQSQWSMPPAEEFGAEEATPARSVEMSREEGSSAAFGDFFGEHDTSSSEAASNLSATPQSPAPGQDSTVASTEDLTSSFTSAPRTPAAAEPASFFSSDAGTALTPSKSPVAEKKSEFRPFSAEGTGAAAAAAAVVATTATMSAPKPGPNDTQPIYTDFSDPEPPKASAPPAARTTPPQKEIMASEWESPFETAKAEKTAAIPEADTLEGWEPASASPVTAKAHPQSPAPEAAASAGKHAVTQQPFIAGASVGQPEESHEEDILDLSEVDPSAAVPAAGAPPPPHAEPTHAPPVGSHESPAAQRPKFASLPLDSAVDIEPEPEAEDDDILEASPASRVHGFGAASATPADVQSGFAAHEEPDDILGESAAPTSPGAFAGHKVSTGADPALIADPSEMANAFPTRFGLDNPEPAVVGLAADAPQIYSQPAQEPASDHSSLDDDILAETDDSPLEAPPSGGEQIHLIQGGNHTAAAAPAATAREASALAAEETPGSAEKISEDAVARLVQNVMDQLRPNLVAEITRQLKEQKPSV